MQNIALSKTIPETIMAPIGTYSAQSNFSRKCSTISDADWLNIGISRVLSDAQTGRCYLQQFGHLLAVCPHSGHFFEMLKSQRRLNHLTDVAEKLADSMPDNNTIPSIFKDYALYAADGHWHDAAAHDETIDDRRWPVGHVYAQNLRTGAIHHLALANGKKEHDMSVIKRLGSIKFRMREATGTRVAFVWDRAAINFRLWHEWKHNNGIYFISRAKDNMALETIGINQFDLKDLINAGVVSDELVATSQHVAVRRVVYINPDDGKQYEFLTTIFDLAPGAIAWLYLQRWGIEKTFDVFKNKLREAKAWATSANAKCMQAEFICLAANLLTLFERHLQETHGIEDVAGRKRQEQRREAQKAKVSKTRITLGRLITEIVRPLVVSVKFIRWVRAHWASSAPLSQLIDRLRTSYATL
jgi:hypothetical protein